MLDYDKAVFKKCSDCQTVKERVLFNKNASSPDGYSYLCKICASIRKRKPLSQEKTRTIKNNARWNDIDNYRKIEHTRNLRRFGLTPEQYEELADRGCAICGTKKSPGGRRLPVDHCHKTGKTRGVLCMFCNTAIGKFRDDPDLCMKAAEYLLSHRSKE